MLEAHHCRKTELPRSRSTAIQTECTRRRGAARPALAGELDRPAGIFPQRLVHPGCGYKLQ
jgi:hypothetical protein